MKVLTDHNWQEIKDILTKISFKGGYHLPYKIADRSRQALQEAEKGVPQNQPDEHRNKNRAV